MNDDPSKVEEWISNVRINKSCIYDSAQCYFQHLQAYTGQAVEIYSSDDENDEVSVCMYTCVTIFTKPILIHKFCILRITILKY